MPSLSDYETALKNSVGKQNAPLIAAHLELAWNFLTENQRKTLENAANNEERMHHINEWFQKFLIDEVKHALVLMAETKELYLLKPKKRQSLPTEENQDIVVTTASPLSQNLATWLEEAISKTTGAQRIRFAYDTSMVGGIKIRVGDTEIDNSLSTKLLRLLER